MPEVVTNLQTLVFHEIV